MPSKVYIPSQVKIQGGFGKDTANFIVHGGLPNSRKNSLRHSLSFSRNMLWAGGIFCAVNPIVGVAIIAYAVFDAGFKAIFYNNLDFGQILKLFYLILIRLENMPPMRVLALEFLG